ncbi:DEAD/DEAH box helicase [Corynebacterium guangdongense]|uniref:SNF2 family DNA or RNA helicase n=1 Tax=Corynebacterium guangdongense TaxID=1783348 RepID=A0ABU1ZVY1_9CORY|nr:DEAD/DEAH box helicase [Corynebacterium guangdongense]MDR7329071.1 SNF2 family DNA or RNA helicase [Corynebacterium guangdongense]WJZ17640.1 ATP-dependent helicase HepA [Corynebacterium guangdongense]
MPDFLLHGLWLRGSGLHLWVEQVKGHKIVLPSAVTEGSFPPVIAARVDDSMFRHRENLTLQTPKGRRVRLPVPTASLSPQRTIDLLTELEPFGAANDPGTRVAPASTSEERASIAPDLHWLIHMYRGLRRFVRAGRVTIGMTYADNEWYPQWQLASGLGERGWLAEMVAAAPGMLSINEPDLAEEMAGTLVHWIASAELAHLQDAHRAIPWHDFPDSLLRSQPVRRGGVGLVRALTDWRNSITAIDLQLVFIVEAPPSDAEITRAGWDPDAEDDAGADPADVVWPVRVQVRSGNDAPKPVRADVLDSGSMELLRGSLRQAVATTDLVDHTLHPKQGSGYRSVDPDAEGDWDTYLSTDEIVRFVGGEAAKLRRVGFTVMLPKAWSTAETSARLETSGADAIGDAATRKHIGMDQLVDYNWRMSVGDTELTDEEMRELVQSKSGLIRLRGEWVLADKSSLAKINAYMEELAETSRKRQRARLDRLAMEAELARANDEPGWALKFEELETLRDRYNNQYAGFGEVTLADLRELALEAAADEPIEFTGSTWHAAILGGDLSIAPERLPIPPTVHAELREYQRRGVDWLHWMSRNNLGAVLADDMGLGKTLQLLTMLAIEIERGEAAGPTLVVAPTSVVGNWAKEAARFVPSLRFIVQHGSDRLHGEDLRAAAAENDLIITSYGVVGRDHKEMSEINWDRVVLDEAQAIKNSTTRSSKAVRALPARHRVALTGTPVENRLSEMRSILDFVNPGILGSASFFRTHFAKPIERDNDDSMTERLRMLTSPFILRRLKTDPTIIDDLPDKSEQILTVDMTPEQAALYTALTESVQRQLEEREGMARRGLVLATITRIKQICNHPAQYLGDGSPVTTRGRHRSGKVEELMRLVDMAIDSDQRMLIFTQYRAFGDILQPYLSERLGEHIPFLHGGTTKPQRDRMVDDFQAADGPRAMLLSLKAGGTGLNLTAASIVVHMDRWWNPAVENQATDRAFRIGQDRNVQVFKMITAGTLEESIQDILDGKTELAGAVIGEGEGWITELDPDQLGQLMSYRGRER